MLIGRKLSSKPQNNQHIYMQRPVGTPKQKITQKKNNPNLCNNKIIQFSKLIETKSERRQFNHSEEKTCRKS